MLRLKATAGSATHHSATPEISDLGLLTQQLFTKMLWLERKRTERSSRGFVLMLLDPGKLLKSGSKDEDARQDPRRPYRNPIRDTDMTGWYKDGAMLGVIFTEARHVAEGILVNTLSTKVTEALYRTLTVGQINEIKLSFHVFPEDWDDDSPDGAGQFEPPRGSRAGLSAQRTIALHAKRLMDIAGSLAAILLCLPVFIAIAVAIKLTSKGPVLLPAGEAGTIRQEVHVSEIPVHVLQERSQYSRTIREAVYCRSDGSRIRRRKCARSPTN